MLINAIIAQSEDTRAEYIDEPDWNGECLVRLSVNGIECDMHFDLNDLYEVVSDIYHKVNKEILI